VEYLFTDHKNSGQLKRICRSVIMLIRWLISHESESERGNFFYTQFVQLPLNELMALNFAKHIMGTKKKKKNEGVDENEDIFVLLGVLVNDHRTPEGKSIDDLLPGNNDAINLYNEWANSGEIEQVL
jgi:hypothetical protein